MKGLTMMNNHKPNMIMDSLYMSREMQMEIKHHLVSRFPIPVSRASVVRCLLRMWMLDLIPLTLEDIGEFGRADNGQPK
jgi:hypothetical protein